MPYAAAVRTMACFVAQSRHSSLLRTKLLSLSLGLKMYFISHFLPVRLMKKMKLLICTPKIEHLQASYHLKKSNCWSQSKAVGALTKLLTRTPCLSVANFMAFYLDNPSSMRCQAHCFMLLPAHRIHSLTIRFRATDCRFANV